MNGTNRNKTRTKANLNVNKTLKICHFRHLISIFEKLLTWGKSLLSVLVLHEMISKQSLAIGLFPANGSQLHSPCPNGSHFDPEISDYEESYKIEPTFALS